MSKKAKPRSAPPEQRKVRLGATHMNQEQMAHQRAMAFSRRIARAHTLETEANRVTLIGKPKAPWLYPIITSHTITKKRGKRNEQPA